MQITYSQKSFAAAKAECFDDGLDIVFRTRVLIKLKPNCKFKLGTQSPIIESRGMLIHDPGSYRQAHLFDAEQGPSNLVNTSELVEVISDEHGVSNRQDPG